MISNENNRIDLIYDVLQHAVEFIWLILRILYAMIEHLLQVFQYKTEMDIRDKLVLITGTGHGIGKELAIQYAKKGAKVICWDINKSTNTQTVEEITSLGGIAYGYTCDVTQPEQVEELKNRIQIEHGFVSVVVNNAGIMPCRMLSKYTENEIKLLYDINVLGNLWVIRAFLPQMLAHNCGHFVSLSSCAGLFGIENLVPYCGSKYAVRGIMQALGEELHQMNPQNKIKLTTIYPYMVDTGLCKKAYYRFDFMKLIPPQKAAAAIIKAQLTGIAELSIPSFFLILENFGRNLPLKVVRLVKDYVNSGVEADS